MAGIGFELKKLFSRRGLFASFRAYGYAGIICTGPMLLGIVLLLGVMFLCDRTGASKQSRELLVCMITYTLLASLTVTSFLSMVVTRFIADMLYEEKNEAVLSSFWGSTGLMLIAGGILYGIFLIFSGVGLIDKFLCFELFGELIVTWNAMSYLTAIKDYRGIMLSFLAAIAVTFLSGAEVNFYPKYRNYYSLFNDGGTIKDIMQAGTEMLDVLNRELKYTALKQLLTTALAISMGESLLKYLPLGFNDLMYGYFRTLCVGYGIYAVANTMLLLLLYFTDYRGALAASVIFAVGTSVFTVISLFCPQVYYGFGFLAGCVLFYFIVMIRLERYTRRLPYYILSIQPVVAEDKSGVFTRIGCFMDEKLERRTSVDRN